jgi:hypothetical protein
MRRRGFLSVLASPLQANGLRFVSEFSDKLGLFDISEDGEFLAMHQRAGAVRCERSPDCRDAVHRISAVHSIGRRSGRSTQMVFGADLSFRWAIAFIPGTQNLILRGKRLDIAGPPGFYEWNPIKDDWRSLAEPPPRFEFFAVFDHSRALGKVLENRTNRNILWDFRTGQVSEIPIDTDWSDPAGAMLLAYRSPEDALRNLDDLKDQRVYNAAVSQRVELVVISGEKGRGGYDEDPRRNRKFVSVYDGKSRERLRRQELFVDEKVVERTSWFGRVAYTEGTIHHIASQMAISPSGDLFAFSFERYDAASPLLPGWDRREPKFSVYRLDSLKPVGTVSHPKRTHWEDDGIHSEAGGKLLFSRDGQTLYTTTTSTREWRIV